jgi:hypothetical protein
MPLKRGRRPKVLDLEAEYQQHLSTLREMIGKPVPLSRSYTQGEQPIWVPIEDGTATVRFRNGAVLKGVPIMVTGDGTQRLLSPLPNAAGSGSHEGRGRLV